MNCEYVQSYPLLFICQSCEEAGVEQRWSRGSDERGTVWKMVGADVVLYHDPLDRSGDLQGCWVANGGDFTYEHIDHYLRDSMKYVEGRCA